MSDPRSPKFIIALCVATIIKPNVPHHNSHHGTHTVKYRSETHSSHFISFRFNQYSVIYLGVIDINIK